MPLAHESAYATRPHILVRIVHGSRPPLTRVREQRPLGLIALGGLTPSERDASGLDDSLGASDSARMPCRQDSVGITARRSQANRQHLPHATAFGRYSALRRKEDNTRGFASPPVHVTHLEGPQRGGNVPASVVAGVRFR